MKKLLSFNVEVVNIEDDGLEDKFVDDITDLKPLVKFSFYPMILLTWITSFSSYLKVFLFIK